MMNAARPERWHTINKSKSGHYWLTLRRYDYKVGMCAYGTLAEARVAATQWVHFSKLHDGTEWAPPCSVRAEDARTEDSPEYIARPAAKPVQTREQEDAILDAALAILKGRMRQPGAAMDKPGTVKDFMCLTHAGLQHEVFTVMFLDSQHRMIECREMFQGTLGQTSVYPREVVRAALELHAAAVILSHNHPSGSVAPSRADEVLTQTLRSALSLVDVRVLDHIIVSGTNALSMAERGLI